MTIRVDNSYMYKYLEEMHQREVAKTAAKHAESKRKEIPFIVAKYAGIAAIIISIGVALYFANSYKQITETINLANNKSQEIETQYSAVTDDVIDIDALLDEVDKDPIFPSTKTQPLVNEVNVRNYVIFDKILFAGEGFEKITIGRQYDDPESDVTSSWCYVDRINSKGFKNTLYLVSNFEVRDVLDIDNEIAESFGSTKESLLEAQELCTI